MTPDTPHLAFTLGEPTAGLFTVFKVAVDAYKSREQKVYAIVIAEE